MIAGRLLSSSWLVRRPGPWLLAGWILLASPPPALGAGPEISIVPSQPEPGERVTVRGAGFCAAPCWPVRIAVDGAIVAGAVAVAADGAFTVLIALTPVSGTTTIVASQPDSAGRMQQATAVVRVVAADRTSGPPSTSAPPGTPDPAPGRSDLPMVAGAAIVAAIAIVVAGILVARRRMH